jgi:hypothetical protein
VYLHRLRITGDMSGIKGIPEILFATFIIDFEINPF